MRIAVVDDDATFLDLLTWVFHDRGWEVLTFDHEEGTFAALSREIPDVIILDIRLGTGHSGWNILTLLEGDPRTFHIPVVVCSAALDEIRVREQWLKQRGVAVLNKPFDLELLYGLVEPHAASAKPIRARQVGA